MTAPTTLPFSKLLILIGDGASPEVFSAPCGLTSKGFDTNASSNDVLVPDCDDPDAPAWVARVVKSLSGKVSGSGIMAVESFHFWNTWSLSGLPKNVRIQLVGTGLGYYSGSFLLTNFSLKASLGDKIQVDVAMDSDQQVSWTDV